MKLKSLASCGIQSRWLIFKDKVLIYQSKAKLDVNILFGNGTHLLGLEIRKMQVRSLYGNKNATFNSGL